jgi:uncharacterized protein YydD (DUF2326 family)
MLRRLTSNDPRFKSFDFRRGLNLVVADKAGGSTETDSRNSAGKSSMVELFHFLLGGGGDKGSVNCIWTGRAYLTVFELDDRVLGKATCRLIRPQKAWAADSLTSGAVSYEWRNGKD